MKLIGIVFIFSSFTIWGQEIKKVRDFGVWTSVGVSYKLNKDWGFIFSEDVRLFDNSQKLDKLITDAGVTYRINSQFKLGFNARYALSRRKDYTFTQDFRYNIDFKYKLKLSKAFDLKYRFRFQNNYIDLFTYEGHNERRSNARNRLEIEYDLKKHSIYFSTELFREFTVYKKPEFNNLRISLGDQYETGLGDFNYAFSYERELDDDHPLNFFYIKLGYTFKFKHE